MRTDYCKFLPGRRWGWILFIAMACTGCLRAADRGTIVFFGDSLTAGFGLSNPAHEAYPALIGQKIESAHLPWRVVNAGVSGETSADGLRRIDWILRQPVDVFVLALGANDGLRGVAPETTRANLDGIIDRVRSRYPAVRILLAGMRMPPNMGEDYAREFAAIFPAVAKKEGVPLIPFLLEGVGGRAEFNQPDGMHPTAAGHRMIAESVWAALLPILNQQQGRP